MIRWLVLGLIACSGAAPQKQTATEVTCPKNSTWSGSACVGAVVVRAQPEAPPPPPPPKCETALECTERCDRGEYAACSTLGIRYDEGDGVTKDVAKAKELFEIACSNKDPEGCYHLALGWGDDASKFANYKTACDADYGAACTNLGVRYARGKGVTADLVRAREIADKACRLGDAIGCGNLGLYMWKGLGGAKDLEQAAVLSRKACDGDDASACSRLATLHENGEGVAKDVVLARRISQRACDLDKQWCNDLGVMYMNGVGGDRDPRRAKQLYEKACEANEPIACVNLGRIWRDGTIDDAVNFGEAADLFDKACKLNNSEGCEQLAKLADEAKEACDRDAKQCTNWGYMNRNGLGVPRSDQAALKLYERACTAKRAVACSNLAAMHRDGEGTPASPKKALQYYDRACKLNKDSACAEAKALRAK